MTDRSFFVQYLAKCLAAAFLCLATTILPTLASKAGLHSASGRSVRALVVGIDRYINEDVAPRLYGAVADAKDIAGVLRQQGVRDLSVLLDYEATRKNIMSALNRLEKSSKSGDLLIITFAGHGSLEPEKIPGSEPDGMDEVIVLTGFGLSAKATRERIFDNELYAFFARLEKRNLQIVLVVDSCYSGGMSKAVDPRAGRLSVRGLKRVERPGEVSRGFYYIDPKEDQLANVVLDDRENGTLALSNVTLVAAVEPSKTSPEIRIDGTSGMRGALSYAMARALEGKADLDGDKNGVTTRGELSDYLRKSVRMLTQYQQNPVLEPHLDGQLKLPLFKSTSSAFVQASHQQKTGTSPVILVELEPNKKQSSGSFKPGMTQIIGSTLAPASANSRDLTYDRAKRELIDATGTIVAYDMNERHIQSAKDRINALRSLRRLADGRSLDTHLSPHESNYRHGEKFKAHANGINGRYIILLNMTGSGEIQYLFPKAGHDPFISSKSHTWPLTAAPSFGADTLIVLATAKRRFDLEGRLQLLHGKRSPLTLVNAVKTLSTKDKLGLIFYTTQPRR